MEDENLKLAFSRVKEDMLFLSNEISCLKYEIQEIKSLLSSLHEEINNKKFSLTDNSTNKSTDKPTDRQTLQHIKPTDSNTPTHIPTHPQEIEGLKTLKNTFSTGNEGVPTDRQTDKQTNRQTHLQGENLEINLKKAQNILDSLDSIKKEIRQKFKKLTPQEMLVFSSIYQLEEQDPANNTYKKIAENLGLSESSIRDYVLKLADKGIPIKKQKIDNKKVLLSVSEELRKIATLSTIMQLREL